MDFFVGNKRILLTTKREAPPIASRDLRSRGGGGGVRVISGVIS